MVFILDQLKVIKLQPFDRNEITLKAPPGERMNEYINNKPILRLRWTSAFVRALGCLLCSACRAGTHCAYPRRDGQAKLTWVAGYIQR